MKLYLGENIRQLRQEKGITQETLADFLGVTFQSVSRWERNEGYPDISLLPSIASYFNVSIDSLLGVGKMASEKKIDEYLEIFDNMGLKDLPSVLSTYQKAVKDCPGDFRILVRYMHLLQETKIRSLSLEQILDSAYMKTSEEISKIYEVIQKNCTDDSIRMWSKTIMISHLMWKYDCIFDNDGKYRGCKEYLQEAQEIINTLPPLRYSREIMQDDREDYYSTHKTALEELIYLLQKELFGYCLNYTAEKRILQIESLQNLLELVYSDGNYEKNSYNYLYNLGHLGHLYQQIGNDQKALEYLEKAAIYAKKLDRNADASEQAKKYYNYGQIYRETTAAEFMQIVMTEHYPLSDEFKTKPEFKSILEKLL